MTTPTEIQAYQERGALMSAGDLRTQVNMIQEAMKAVMRRDVHYGVIPGCKQPSLYKAGSEVLLTMFHIAVSPEVEELREGSHIRYRVKAVGTHQQSGIVVGCGIGECSTSEDKYAWRRAVCEEEYDVTDPTMRRIRFQKYKGDVEKQKQVRTNPADLSNTVLKMAKKRAQIDLCLTATAASDIFTQDIEDLPEDLQDREAARNAPPPMTQEEIDAQTVYLDSADGTGDLRKRLQVAMKVAEERQDKLAHKAIKDHAVALSQKLAAKETEAAE